MMHEENVFKECWSNIRVCYYMWCTWRKNLCNLCFCEREYRHVITQFKEAIVITEQQWQNSILMLIYDIVWNCIKVKPPNTIRYCICECMMPHEKLISVLRVINQLSHSATLYCAKLIMPTKSDIHVMGPYLPLFTSYFKVMPKYA